MRHNTNYDQRRAYEQERNHRQNYQRQEYGRAYEQERNHRQNYQRQEYGRTYEQERNHRQNYQRQEDGRAYAYEQERPYRQNYQRQEYGRNDGRERNNYLRRPEEEQRGRDGFCIDTSAEQSLTNLNRAFGNRQSPSYSRLFYKDNVLGASEHYVNNVQFGCKLKIKEEDLNVSTDEKKPTKSTPNSKIKTVQFFSVADKPPSNSDHNQDMRDAEYETNEKRKESKKTIQEKVEYYNSELRNQPTNEALWKEFVQFQEQVFDTEQEFEDERSAGTVKSTKKGRRKAMLEKQIAILDKAVEANPKNLELHILRLNIMFEVFRPSYVLTEWKKLVATTHAQVAPFWIEYLGFACSDLQIYSTSVMGQSFERAFEKFRTMLAPDFPKYQKPEKITLFLADLLLSVSLILKAAGHTERAISLHQAQIEIHLNSPKSEKLDSIKSDDAWKSILESLEEFWNSGQLRFGEPGAQGLSKSLKEHQTTSKSRITISDNAITEFEDLFFEKLNESSCVNSQENSNWLLMESMRSKLYWLPWRTQTSDITECDDSQRTVQFDDVSSYLVRTPDSTYESEFERQSSKFRYIVNFLLFLREDFLPRTYTLDSILSTFTSRCMTESRTLLNEIYFWKKYLNFYHDDESGSEKVPEGFRVGEFTSPGYFTSDGKGSIPVTKPPVLSLFPAYDDSIEIKKQELLKQNQDKYLSMVRTVVEHSIEHLDATFASVLVNMLLRFEQKNKYASLESHKTLMKYVRNLVKHEKLRSTPSCYGEIALIEYFDGTTEKATELLVKTINTSRSFLHTKEELNLESDWQLVTDLCRLYRLLAEFYLKEQPEVSINILLALGDNFDIVSTDLSAGETSQTKNKVLKAKRQFESILKWFVPFVGDPTGIIIDCEVSALANKLDGDKCVEFMLQKPNAIVEWTCAYALFQFLSNDFEAASEVYNSVLDKVKTENVLSRASKYNSEEVSISHMREQLYLGWCKIGAMAVSQNPMINSKFRNILSNAMQEFPSSPPFLVLFSQVERQCSIAGRLWRSMLNLVKQESTQAIVNLHWTPLFMSLNLATKIDELEHDAEMSLEPFGLGGPAVPPDTIFYKLDAILSAAETHSLTKHCPLIWRVHMKHLAIRVKEGKDRNRARTLFYDAIRHCPSNKSIYLDAIAYFPEMKREINDLMGEKQILIRLPDEEFKVLMEIDTELKEELDSKGKHKRAANDSSESDSDIDEKRKSKKPKIIKRSSKDYDEGEIVELSD